MSKKSRVAFQGAHYAFSESAIRKFFSEKPITVPCRTFEDVFKNVKDAKVDYGAIPIENSVTGSIHRNYDLLLQFELQIVGETFLRIQQHLIACPGVQMEDIKLIYSHPQALEQCRKFLSTLPQIQTVASYDTAGSVKMIKEKKMLHAAAIAGEWPARDYGMQILQREIEDYKHNFTRFLIVSKTFQNFAPPNKTSIVFSMKNIPGALFKCLSVFALRDIDLIKIESRPLRNKPWDYFFYLSFAGHLGEERCKNAIRHLKEITSFMTVLGSYPSDELETE